MVFTTMKLKTIGKYGGKLIIAQNVQYDMPMSFALDEYKDESRQRVILVYSMTIVAVLVMAGIVAIFGLVCKKCMQRIKSNER